MFTISLIFYIKIRLSEYVFSFHWKHVQFYRGFRYFLHFSCVNCLEEKNHKKFIRLLLLPPVKSPVGGRFLRYFNFDEDSAESTAFVTKLLQAFKFLCGKWVESLKKLILNGCTPETEPLLTDPFKFFHETYNFLSLFTSTHKFLQNC